jgi:hypothetical protein
MRWVDAVWPIAAWKQARIPLKRAEVPKDLHSFRP